MDELEAQLAHAQMRVLRNPGEASAWCQLGSRHHILASSGIDHYLEAHLCFERAYAMAPNVPEASIGFSASAYTLRQYDMALQLAEKATRIASEHGLEEIANVAQLAEAGILLKIGRWQEGWTKAEARLHLPQAPTVPFDGTLADIRGSRVYVRGEQGFGDNIEFMRYIPRLKQYCPNISVEAPPKMLELFEAFLPGIPVHYEKPNCDIEISLLSLPLLLGPAIGWEPIKPLPVPDRLQSRGYKVGICRASLSPSPTTLRKNPRPHEFREFINSLNVGSVKSLMEQDLGDCSWMDTAIALMKCGLVISVDTAVAHLAASMGIETWLIQRYDSCWRWDHPSWYPGVRIFQQPAPGDWPSVFQAIREALAAR